MGSVIPSHASWPVADNRSGMPLSFGIFEKFYSSIEPFKSEAGIPAIGSSGFVSQSTHTQQDTKAADKFSFRALHISFLLSYSSH